MVCGTGDVRWRAPFGSGTKSRVCKAFLDKSQALPGRSVGTAFVKMADQGRGFRAETGIRARVRAGRRGSRPALVPCTKSVLQSHAIAATAKQLPCLNSITTR